MSRWSISSEFSFCGGKTRFSHAIAANKRANSHNFKTKNLNLLTITFLAVYLRNRKHCRESSLFFKSVHALSFFHTRSLIDRCQIETDTCQNNVSKFVWKPFKSPLSLRKWNVLVKHLPLICMTPILTTIYSLKNYSVYGRSWRLYSPKSFGFFRKEFR